MRCPKAMKTKGTKRSDKKKNKKTTVIYTVKRPPKWEGAPPYGASQPTSPGNRTPPREGVGGLVEKGTIFIVMNFEFEFLVRGRS